MRRYLIGAVVALAVAGFVVLVGGRFYEISATRQHPVWIYWVFQKARNNLVWWRAAGIEPPPGFEPAATPENVALYRKHCAQCHGAPGVAPEDFALGMMPVPPPLVFSARERPPAQIYWFIRYGLKMSGMPTWHGRMSESDMWRVTALVEALPEISPVEWAALVEASGEPLDAVDPRPPEFVPATVADAVPERGRVAMQAHGCHSCHDIPGVVGPDPHVGPPLEYAGARRYIAGVLRNTPENMVRWIMDPQEVDPLTAMPDLDITLGEARDMAAYLYAIAPAENRTGSEMEALRSRQDGIGFAGPTGQ